jgi:hypothetical protein
MALVARAIGLRREEFAQIHLHARKLKTNARGVDAADLGQALAFFDRTGTALASAVLTRWRHDSAPEPIDDPGAIIDH